MDTYFLHKSHFKYNIIYNSNNIYHSKSIKSSLGYIITLLNELIIVSVVTYYQAFFTHVLTNLRVTTSWFIRLLCYSFLRNCLKTLITPISMGYRWAVLLAGIYFIIAFGLWYPQSWLSKFLCTLKLSKSNIFLDPPWYWILRQMYEVQYWKTSESVHAFFWALW